MTRTRIGVALCTAVLTALGLLGMPTVASAQPSPAGPGGDATTTKPGPGPSAGGYDHDGFLKDVLHGEGVVQTRTGPVRVAIQKGTITSANGSSVAVKSADGWSRTWTLTDKVQVYEHRDTLQPSALTVGSKVTVAGTVIGGTGASGGTYTAKVVQVHARGGAQLPSEPPAPESSSS